MTMADLLFPVLAAIALAAPTLGACLLGMAIWIILGGGKADLPQAEVESEMSAYLAQRRSEESQRPWGYECNQCGCQFPAGDDECPDCGSDDLSRHVF